MIVSVHQPPYLPWLGLLEKIALSQRFVVLDTVQYGARGFLHRTLYSTDAGAKYLSLSVRHKGHQQEGTTIAEVELADRAMPGRHLKTLRQRYGKRPGWPVVAAGLEPILLEPAQRLVELNVELLRLSMRLFGIHTEVAWASELGAEGTRTRLMADLTKAAGGTAYLSGSGARAYLDEEVFHSDGLGLYWQSFEHPIYRQSHTGGFQEGCFGLEWVIEDPDGAADGFRAHVERAAGRIGLPS